MNGESIDNTMGRLRSATAAIRANLVEVEVDPARELLDAVTLEGESARRWGHAREALVQLWVWLELLDDTVKRAEAVRGGRAHPRGRRLEEIEHVLYGESIEIAGDQVPLERRELLSAGSGLRFTADQLLETSVEAFEDVKSVIVQASRSWEELAPRVRELQAETERCRELASTLGEGEAEPFEDLQRRAQLLAAELSHDPLAVDSELVEELDASLQAARERLGEVTGMRDELALRLQRAAGLLDELGRAAQESRVAGSEAAAKIAGAATPEPAVVDESMRRRLDQVRELAENGAWREARASLEAWTSAVDRMLERARSVQSESVEQLRTRDELRGLLNAYEAKARSLRLVENPRFAQAHRRAEESLYVAPTDLAAARELVGACGRILAEPDADMETSL